MASLQAVVPTPAGSEQPQYVTLSPDSEPMRLESLCVSCMKNVRRLLQLRRNQQRALPEADSQASLAALQGVTTLLMTKIPFFREARCAAHSRDAFAC